MYENYFIALIGFAFLFAYLQEKDDLFKWIWLFLSFTLFTVSFFANNILINAVADLSITNSITMNYIYSTDNTMNNLGYAFGILSLGFIILIIFRFIREYMIEKGIKIW